MARPAIDALFRSAAACYGPRVIGIVLSGLLSDGASGLDAIKRCGGMAVVQDPAEAAEGEMPLRALEAVTADLVAPAASIGAMVADIVGEGVGPPLPIPHDILLEVDIAAGDRMGTELRRFAEAATLTCPDCGGVLSTVKTGNPLRFRCQVGHAFAAEVLANEQESSVDEALRVALRIVEERAELVSRMADEGRRAGRRAVAEMYEDRAREYRGHAEVIRRAVMNSLQGDVLQHDAAPL